MALLFYPSMLGQASGSFIFEQNGTWGHRNGGSGLRPSEVSRSTVGLPRDTERWSELFRMSEMGFGLCAWQILEVRDFLWLANASVPPLTEAPLKMKRQSSITSVTCVRSASPRGFWGFGEQLSVDVVQQPRLEKQQRDASRWLLAIRMQNVSPSRQPLGFHVTARAFITRLLPCCCSVCTAGALWLDSLEARKAWKWNVTQKTNSLV